MNTFKKVIIFCSVYTFFSQIAISNPEHSRFYCINKFSGIITDLLVESSIPGAAIAVVSNKKILYMKTYGVKNIDTGEPVNKDTLFRIASVSKLFTSLLISKLHEEGLLNIDHNAINYLPTLSLLPETKFSKIRIIDILNHSSGAQKYSLEDQAYSRQSKDNLFKKIKQINIIFPPGKVYGYQNVIYSLLGLIVESATGNSFSLVLEKKIFKPLQIKNYTLCDKDYENHRNIALPHSFDKKKNNYRRTNCPSFYDNILPAGGIAISTNEAVKFIQALLSKTHPISKEMMDRLTCYKVKTCSKTRPCNKSCFCKKGLTMYYGLGCRIVNISGYDVIYHTGYLSGYSSIIAIIPALELGLIVFINASATLPFDILYQLCEVFINETQ